jgi:anti-sigma28 factor (negative regulator of flagellin synthesis)
MLEQSRPRLNRVTFVRYYLDTKVDAWPHQRINISDVIKGRMGMDVSGLGSVQGGGPVRSPIPAGSAAPANPTASNPAPAALTSPKDELEISAAGQMLDRLGESSEARAERIAQIKEAIDNGEYDTDDKLEAALSRMFEIHGLDLDE